ncbi:MAG: NAD(P)H-dependent flavin oxidoreductase [Mycobacteriaceae bacterium]
MSVVLKNLLVPVIAAPMAGGASTPALVKAVTAAGACGFLAGGLKSPQSLAEQMADFSSRDFGVNLFVPNVCDDSGVAEYLERITPMAREYGVKIGQPRWGDDFYEEKLALLLSDPVSLVSFTFGLPSQTVVQKLHSVGSEVWVTVTSLREAEQGLAIGADALIVQGSEAGGHRGSFADSVPEIALTELLGQVVSRFPEASCIAAGGIMTGWDMYSALSQGAVAVQMGTAFIVCPESDAPEAHKKAILSDAPTAVTRAFSGRKARGIRNKFMDTFDAYAPAAYPQLHYATGPLKATKNPEVMSLWAGVAHHRARKVAAGELIVLLSQELQEAQGSIADQAKN